MALQTMYSAKVNSPSTTLAEPITSAMTSFSVVSATALPPAPNLAVLGADDSIVETILYTGVTNNTLTGVTRGFQGVASDWDVGTAIVRTFTAYDHDTFKGNIENISNRLNNFGSDVKAFGAVGDGVTDDTLAFLAGFEHANLNNDVLLIPAGTYLLKRASIPPAKFTNNWHGFFVKCSSLSGKYNPTIILDGRFGFETTDVDNLLVENITFKLRNSFVTNVDMLADGNIVFDNNGVAKKRVYRNLFFIGEVNVTNGTQRVRGSIMEKVTDNSIFENIYINNAVMGIEIRESDNYIIRNIILENVQTGLWPAGAQTNYTVENIKLNNTFEQSQTWVQKNHPINPDNFHNGMCLILCCGNNYTLHNLNAINPIERCIYANGINIMASKLRCVNGDGFKFINCKNVKITDCMLLVDVDILNLSSQNQVNLATFYGDVTTGYVSENITFSNAKVECTANVTGNPLRAVIVTGNHGLTKNLRIENVHSTVNCGAGLLYNILSPRAGSPAADYLMLEDVIINNCSLHQNLDAEGTFINHRTVNASSDAMTNYTARNIKITNCYVKYGNARARFWHDWRYTDGLYTENNRSNVRTLGVHGLPIHNPVVSNNIILKECDLEHSNISMLLAHLKIITVSKESQLILTMPGHNRTVQIYVDNALTDTELVPIYDNSAITITLNNTPYVGINNMFDNYLIKINSDAGFYMGHVVGAVLTNIISTPPMTITVSANTIVIRGDLYAGNCNTIIEKS